MGLVAGACFADAGNQVTCIDTDAAKIAGLKRGEIPIYEPGLEDLVKRAAAQKRIEFTTSMEDGVRDAEVIFLAVGTPAGADGEPNLTYLRAACESLAPCLTRPVVVVNKSTVPVGAHRVVAEWMRPLARQAFDVVSNPEFLKEGSAVDDFLRPDRIVIGTDSDASFRRMEELYAPFLRQGNPILRMDPVSAEVTKYACNSFLATRISFMNELAQLCEKVGGDVELIRTGMATDVRIGKHFLFAGVGYGGSCFPKDVQALMATARTHGVPMDIVAGAEAVNARQKRHLPTLVRRHYGSASLAGKVFGLWGLAFKPNTDDMRDAPALVIIDELLAAGAKMRVYDPVASVTAKKVLGERVVFCDSAYQVVEGADALLIATEWNEFRHADLQRVKQVLKKPVIFDGRNLYVPEQMRQQGFTYYGIGRGLSAQVT